MHRKYHPRRNPLKLRAGGPSSGAQASTGLRLGAGALSGSDYAYLEQRATDFVSILSQSMGVPTYEFSSDGDSRDAIAKLTATALADKGTARWTHARNHVFNKLPQWVGFGPVPSPFPPVPGP